MKQFCPYCLSLEKVLERPAKPLEEIRAAFVGGTLVCAFHANKALDEWLDAQSSKAAS